MEVPMNKNFLFLILALATTATTDISPAQRPERARPHKSAAPYTRPSALKATERPTLLHQAAEKGDLKKIIPLLSLRNTDVNEVDFFKSTPLQVAAANSKAKAVIALNGHHDIDINAQNMYGWAPLHFATFNHGENGDLIALALLKNPTININVQTNFLQTPLHFAAMNGNATIVYALLQHGASTQLRNRLDQSPFDVATTEIIKSLLAANDTDALGNTPLHRAALTENIAEIQALIKAGAMVNAQNNAKETALFIAVTFERYQAVKTLLEAGADIGIQAINGLTALDIAGNKEIRELIQATQEAQ